MRVLVDSSVWADYLNGSATHETDALHELLAGDDDVCTCGIVVAEVMQGLRRSTSRAEIESGFRDLTFLDPFEIETYLRAAALFRDLRAAGVTIRSTIDCILVAIAAEADCYVLAADRDFRNIAASGAVRLRLWPAGG